MYPASYDFHEANDRHGFETNLFLGTNIDKTVRCLTEDYSSANLSARLRGAGVLTVTYWLGLNMHLGQSIDCLPYNPLRLTKP
jgi:hypothetical protein